MANSKLYNIKLSKEIGDPKCFRDWVIEIEQTVK
jgi:hypothetical protein